MQTQVFVFVKISTRMKNKKILKTAMCRDIVTSPCLQGDEFQDIPQIPESSATRARDIMANYCKLGCIYY